ncbi:MAG: hypothetical protein ACJ73D_03615 [Pyrinomonadaceae bacterium]
MIFKQYLGFSDLQPPVTIAFDHVHSEYLVVRARIEDADALEFIEGLQVARKSGQLTWDNLYSFELILAKHLPVTRLRSRIMQLRYDYRSVAGQKEFDDYMASKPPDLQSPPEPADPPHASHAKYEGLLRDDLSDLLGRLYLEYSILPVREKRLTDLAWFAAKLCLISLGALMLVLGILFLVPLWLEIQTRGLDGLLTSDKLSSLTIFAVVITGAIGGFVSSLRRIQSSPTEGDSLYNLSLLFYGSKTVFIAPISGAIFAILLYLLFTSGVLSGSFFPTIYTPAGAFSTASNQPPATTLAESGAVPDSTPSDPKKTQATPTPTPKPVPQQGENVLDFLAHSGPGAGRDYALLIVWCFIAGFAERFVPDALDRLIDSAKSSGRK